MTCPAYITDMANFIWGNLGSPDDLSVSTIQSKLISNPYLGNLNNLIVTCYSGISGSITPVMSADEQAIYSSMYQKDYYTMKLNQTLQGYGTSFVTLVEGDSRITRASTVDVARVYRDMQKELNDELSMQIASYRQNLAQPQSVIYPTIVNTVGGNGGMPQTYYRS